MIHVVSASDVRYLPHVAALIESIADSNCCERVTFHFLHDSSVTPQQCERLRAMCDRHGLALELLQPPDDLKRLLPGILRRSRYPEIIWYRTRLAELLGSLDRAVYLDPDTLVLQDLLPLWTTDVEDHLLGAVRRDLPRADAYPGAAYSQFLQHGYFSSGVMLLNLKRMREEKLFSRIFQVADMLEADPPFPEQDALNLACEGSWLELHPKWNAYASLYFHGDAGTNTWPPLTLNEAVTSPAILHFESPIIFRPWSVRCIHPHRELYRRYRNRTPWPLPAPESSGLKDRVYSVLPVRLRLFLLRLRLRATPA